MVTTKPVFQTKANPNGTIRVTAPLSVLEYWVSLSAPKLKDSFLLILEIMKKITCSIVPLPYFLKI